jgi:hypothetical protein
LIHELYEEVVEQIGKKSIVDVRSPEEFSGKILAPAIFPQEQPQVPGHIPTAVNVPWSKTAADDGTFRLHCPAEFNRCHVAAYVADEEPGQFVCVYPFNRSLEWHLLPAAERRQQLADHGRAARAYPEVRANTVSSFGLGDYESILAFESPDASRIVDLMRDLRAVEARRHVRVETPFFSGPRTDLHLLVSGLP